MYRENKDVCNRRHALNNMRIRVRSIYKMETERKLLKIPLGFRSNIPRRGIYEYQRPENFAKHNAL
ncbi:unnamed protein product [Bathycoccus prasinos]